LQDDPLALQDLLLRVAVLGHEYELIHGRGEDLFVFRCYEHGGDADELKLDERNDAFG